MQLNQSLKDGLKKNGIDKLNPMQIQTYEAFNKGKDIVLLSGTGSGKTLAFLLPILQGLQKDQNHIQALILAPSRELALQIEDVMRSLGTGFRVSCVYGGHSFQIEKNALRHAPDVLIGTPGRVADHMRRETVDVEQVQTIVMDEFDKSLEIGFHIEMKAILRALPEDRQNVLTSATTAVEIPPFAKLKRPETLDFLKSTKPNTLQLRTVMSPEKDKLNTLVDLLCNLGNEPSLVFCNHRDAVDRISDRLGHVGIIHERFHGGMEQQDRERALVKFRNGGLHFLLTTDLAARGLDIPEIKHIIHYHLPSKEEQFVHRNGRTARMHAQGTAYILFGPDEELPDYLPEAPKPFRLDLDKDFPDAPEWVNLYISAGKKDKINKIDIVGFILKNSPLEKDELGRIELKDKVAFVGVKRSKGEAVADALNNGRLKKKKVRVGISE